MALGRHAQRAAETAALLMRIFGVAALAGIVLIPIAASFQPRTYLNWLFCLLSTAAGVLGSTALYSGFIGGRWERNLLRNAMEEMEHELRRLQSRA